MSYEGLATLLVRFSAVAMIVVQVASLIGTVVMLASGPASMRSAPMGSLVLTSILFLFLEIILFILSRPLAKLLTRGL